MPNFHYFGFPNSYYYRNYRYRPTYNYPTHNNETISHNKTLNKIKEPEKHKNTEEAFLELFGIKLYFDDILLISLIFFLYNEGVKDDGLFMALILLLLS